MIVSIHQPDFIPWLGLFYKMAHSDIFVYLDDAQYSNEADHNVNSIKTSQGEYRLKVPVEQHLGDRICEVRTRDELNWKKKHLKTLQMNYSRATYFDAIYPSLEKIIISHIGSISNLNININNYLCNGFGIDTKIVMSSNLAVTSVREERVIDICHKLGADEYLSGNGARSYQKEDHFTAKGIKLTYLDYKPIKYNQLWPKTGFIPCLSAIDYVFNCGFNWEYVENQISELNSGNR